MGDRRIIPEPPAPRRRESEMLSEAPPALAVCLWQYVRHLRDWVDATADERPNLFPPSPKPWIVEKRRQARAEAGEIAGPLVVIESVLASPATASPSAVAEACDAITAWAVEHLYIETEIQFAELAARTALDNPRLANQAGRLTRNAGDHPRAETWLERGIGLARRRKDWVEYTRGHLGLGLLYKEQGRVNRARRHFHTASVIAFREGHEWLAAEAQHDLLNFMTVQGNLSGAELHARRALAWYPKRHSRLPLLAIDIAFLLICQRHYSAAISILRACVRKLKPPHDLLGQSLFVRALAPVGSAREHQRARDKLLKMLQSRGAFEAAARWNLAHAELAIGQSELAAVSARAALDLARAAKDRETAVLAEQLVGEIEAGCSVAPEIYRDDRSLLELVATLTSRLLAWSPTRRGRMPSRTRSEWAA